jgi:multidrug efflux pump subunit AcrA (membrane-fusion protein)
MAARVDGRVADIPVERGQDVAAGSVLIKIDNPETLAQKNQAITAELVAEAQLAHINAGTRAEDIAARKAALDRAQAAVQRLLLDRIPVMGVIFNYWDPAHSDMYGYAPYRQDLA